MTAKSVIWLGGSRETISEFADDARRIAGFQIWRVQRGTTPSDRKPISSVGLGVREIRIRTGAEHRVLYVAKFAEAIYVLHAFEKGTRQTPKAHLGLARRRLNALISQRARWKG